MKEELTLFPKTIESNKITKESNIVTNLGKLKLSLIIDNKDVLSDYKKPLEKNGYSSIIIDTKKIKAEILFNLNPNIGSWNSDKLTSFSQIILRFKSKCSFKELELGISWEQDSIIWTEHGYETGEFLAGYIWNNSSDLVMIGTQDIDAYAQIYDSTLLPSKFVNLSPENISKYINVDLSQNGISAKINNIEADERYQVYFNIASLHDSQDKDASAYYACELGPQL